MNILCKLGIHDYVPRRISEDGYTVLCKRCLKLDKGFIKFCEELDEFFDCEASNGR